MFFIFLSLEVNCPRQMHINREIINTWNPCGDVQHGNFLFTQVLQVHRQCPQTIAMGNDQNSFTLL